MCSDQIRKVHFILCLKKTQGEQCIMISFIDGYDLLIYALYKYHLTCKLVHF